MVAAAAYGACVALAGLMPSDLAGGCCSWCSAGAADMISAVFRGTVWNQTIPEPMRGRLAGIEMLSYSLGPLGGQVRAGVSPTSGRCAARSSAAAWRASPAWRSTALWLRDFWAYDARTDEHAVAEREVRRAAGEAVD